MKKLIGKLSQSKAALLAMGVPAGVVPAVAATADATVSVQENAQQSLNIVGARMINPTTLEILYSNGTRMSMDFYGENIFRIFQDNQGGIIRDPQATPEAQILVDNPRKTVSQIELNDQKSNFILPGTVDRFNQLLPDGRLEKLVHPSAKTKWRWNWC